MWGSEQEREQDPEKMHPGEEGPGGSWLTKAGPRAELSGRESLCEVLCPIYTQGKCTVSFLSFLCSLCQALCKLH